MLKLGIARMRYSINFDYKQRRYAREVRDVRSNWVLPSKSVPE